LSPNILKNYLATPHIARKEYIDWKKTTAINEGTSWILRYMAFLDIVAKENLATAWDKVFKKHEKTDSFEYDINDPENVNFYDVKADNHSKTRNILEEAQFESDKLINERKRLDTLNPMTGEEVKVGELVDEALAEITSSSSKKNFKRKSKKYKSAAIDTTDYMSERNDN
jgi:hypothetical protein